MITISKGDLQSIRRLLAYFIGTKPSDTRGKEKTRQAALLLKKLQKKENDEV